MPFWKNLLKKLRPRRTSKTRSFEMKEGALPALSSKASGEQGSPGEVARSLLERAVEERAEADFALQIWPTLTEREQQVVALICLNYSTPEISRRLVVSQPTVKTHLYNARQKFGVNNRAELRKLLSHWDFSDWEDLI